MPSTNTISRQSIREIGLFAFALAIVAIIYGAVPFVALPTLGQALWISSFAQSFANSGWPAIFAHNFGIPAPAPIAFGLSGAFMESFFLSATRLNAADAYSSAMLVFLALALWGAMRFARTIGLRYPYAIAMAVVWGTCPVIWAHSGYSMLSIGIAMLPLYLWSAYVVCEAIVTNRQASLRIGIGFVAITILSIFTDGYTFVMFAVGTAIQYAGLLVSNRAFRGPLLGIGVPVYSIGFGVACALYLMFIGGDGYAAAPLTVFRGYGVDLTMLAFPTKGLFWLWDTLHFGLVRNDAYYFGDASVWITTFCTIFVLLGTLGCFLSKNRPRAIPLMVTGILAMYLALGPSFKIHSQRSEADRSVGNFRTDMPAQYAVAPTGTAVLWTHVPGFKNMRASYRWMALSLVCFWALFALLVAELVRRDRTSVAWMLIVLVVISNLPRYQVDLVSSVVDPIGRTILLHPSPLILRRQFADMDRTVVADFRRDVPAGSTVAFFPQGNDFLAAYLASVANVRTFNIGGDKNLVNASQHWPSSIKALFGANPHSLAGNIALALNRRDASVVVVSYLNLLWDAHRWPPIPQELANARQNFADMLNQFAADPRFSVKQSTYYATITLRR